MTFGPDIIMLCPDCRHIFIRRTLASGNTFGASFWSDGYYFASMLPVPPLIQWCGSCGAWFFLEDARIMFEVPMGFDLFGCATIPLSDDVTGEQYAAALLRAWPREREAGLRIRLLWQLNHPLRSSRGDVRDVSLAQQENLERLSELLSPEKNTLMLAEVFRELGEFDKCLRLLDASPVQDDDVDPGKAAVIRREAAARNILPVLV